MPANIAPTNVISTDGVSIIATYTIMPLITNINRPRLSKMAGNDRMMIMGRKSTFTNENTRPASKKVAKPVVLVARSLLESTHSANQSASELISQRIKKNVNCCFILCYKYSRLYSVFRGV